MPNFTIIAGVNGAGKSTLIDKIKNDFNLGIAINADDIARKLGDFNDNAIQIRAGKEALRSIDDCIKNKVDFNYETTLSGKGIFKKVEDARKQGFKIELIYISIDKETSKERINNRTLKGGHNIPLEDIERRYEKSIENFKSNLDKFDTIYFYENQKEKHNLIFAIENNQVMFKNKNIPEWINEKFNIENLFEKVKFKEVDLVAEDQKKIYSYMRISEYQLNKLKDTNIKFVYSKSEEAPGLYNIKIENSEKNKVDNLLKDISKNYDKKIER